MTDGTGMDFEQFVTERLPRLVRFTAALCADRALAEDVVQDVLVRVHARWPTVAARGDPEGYVRRALVNEYLSWRRKWARIVPRADLRASDRAEPDPAERITQRSELAALLAALPPRQRAVLVLRYYEDLPDRDIADLLGCRETTVRGYAARALHTLRVEYDRKDQHAR